MFENSSIRHIPNSFSYEKPRTLKYGFCKKYFKRNEPLTSWTLLSPVFFQISAEVHFYRSNFLQNPYFRSDFLFTFVYPFVNLGHLDLRVWSTGICSSLELRKTCRNLVYVVSKKRVHIKYDNEWLFLHVSSVWRSSWWICAANLHSVLH